MKKPGFKFFILQRLARQLRSWANLASRLSVMEDQGSAERADSRQAASVSQASSSATTEEPSELVKDRESIETAGPPAHWLARIEAERQPAHWLSHVSTNRSATQKSQERQNLQEPQSQKKYISQESRTPSSLAPIIPLDDKERTKDQGAQVTENTLAEEDVNRQATINSANNAAEHIVMNSYAPVTEKNAMQRWEQGVVFAPIIQLDISSTSAPRDWPISATTSDPSLWQEKVALPVMPKTEQNPIPQDQRAALVSTFRSQDQMREPMQTVLPGPSFPEETTPNRTIVGRDQIVEQHNDRESVILQELTAQKDDVHRWPQKGMLEHMSQPDQSSPPPAAKLLSQVVQVDSPSEEAISSRRALLGREPAHWAQACPTDPVSLSLPQDQADIPPQATMFWPSLPEDTMLNMTSDSQDLTLMRRIWERQQRLNEEQRGNLWNA